VEAGPALAAARAHLAACAAAMGRALPAFQRVDLDRTGLTHALVPAGAERVHLCSPCRVPAGERRRLGVAIGALTLGGKAVALDDCCLADGFHAPEQSAEGTWRWTDGEAVLRLAPAGRARVLTVRVTMLVPWQDGVRRAA
jgi:hypothetical protein